MTLSLHAAARSDVGLVRASNQDSGYAGVRFLVVADGMGGHAGGDVASAVAVAELIGLDDEAHGEQAPQRLAAAVARAQQALLDRVAVEPALAGMGTTVTAILRAGDRLVLAHLGDSRAYLLHEGRLVQVTRDHTFVQRLVDEGRITAEEAEHHPQRNVILRVLGDVQSSPEPDLSVRDAEAGDRWLLCSDGLPRVVSDETIERTLLELDDVGDCADRLVQLALRAGAPDNVTCIVADVLDADAAHAGSGEDAAAARASDGSGKRQVVGAAGGGSPHADRGVRVPTSPALRAAVLGRSPAAAPVPTATAVSDEVHDDPAAGGEPSAPGPRTGEHDDDPDEGSADGAGAHPPPGRPTRGRWGLRLLVFVLVAVVLGGGALAGSAWLGRQYFVADDGGQVAVYRGLSQDLGPVSLSTLVERSDVSVAQLPEVWRSRVAQTIPADDLSGAQAVVSELRSEVRPDASGTSTSATTAPATTDATTQAPTDAPTTEPAPAQSAETAP
ncbi:PP2C family serine/threonine-protein phosphatase [Quadrisphaera sp. INWT6]|uniref:PP2C family protein-serine/threonine phosphatase n=1 Tax=Quadrisphaera sp. INWT6 TaxID=2596917 RepID=UPI0019D5F1C7|nr:PP2C family serine/threonine-protein phosphatase [Quadrisphaera sp. INWT6]